MSMFSKTALAASLVLILAAQAKAQIPEGNAPQMPAAAKPKSKIVEEKVITESGGSIKVPRAFFVSPKEGESVKGPEVKIVFGIEGMKIENAGVVAAGTGHHHLIIDGSAVKRGEVVPADDRHIHFGLGQTETTVKLPKGKHTLTLQFADGNHASYGEMMSQTISITVK